MFRCGLVKAPDRTKMGSLRSLPYGRQEVETVLETKTALLLEGRVHFGLARGGSGA